MIINRGVCNRYDIAFRNAGNDYIPINAHHAHYC